MRESDIRSAVCRAIAEVCGRNTEWAQGLADSCRPIGGIEGFDSYSAEEAIAGICDFLDHDFPLRFNPFIAETKHRAHTIGEIVQAIYEHMPQPKQVS